MIFLSKLNNMELSRSICFPDDIPRLNRNTAVLIPSLDDDSYFKVIKRIRTNKGRLRIKGMNFMFYPKMMRFKAGSKNVLHTVKSYPLVAKELKASTGCTVMNNLSSIRDYNMVYNFQDIVKKMNDSKVVYNKLNVINKWKTLLNFNDVNHDRSYILVTPEVARVNIKNRGLITANMWKIPDLYISLLWHLCYKYDEMVTLFKEHNIKLLFTDGSLSFRVDFKDPKFEEDFPEQKDVLNQLFFNLRKMRMGIPVDGEIPETEVEKIITEASTTPIDDIVKYPPEGAEEDDVYLTTTTMKIVEKLKDNETETSSIEEKDDDETIDEATDNLAKEKENPKDVTEKITEILTKGKPKVELNPRRDQIKKKQDDIKNKNLVEVAAKLDAIADSILKKDVTNPDNKLFNSYSVSKMDEQYEEIAKKDRLSIAESFNTNSVPLYLTGFKDVDDDNVKDMYTRKVQMSFESPHNSKEKHTFTLNIPKLRDGKFLHINGSDKVMIRQKMALPIIRLQDRVVMTSYYGKMFMMLTNGNYSKGVARIKTFVRAIRKRFPQNYLKKWFSFTPAYFNAKNKNILSPELLEISRFISYIKIDKDNYIDLTSTMNMIKINGEYYNISSSSDVVTNEIDGKDISVLQAFNLICNMFEKLDKPIFDVWYDKIRHKTSDNISYSRLEISGTKLPTIIVALHATGENLAPILDVMKNDYGLIYDVVPYNGDKLPKSKFTGDNTDRFIFGTFALDVKYTSVAQKHLLQYLNNIDLKVYDSLHMDGITVSETHSSNIVMSLETFEDLFWDPITKNVMEDCGIPNDYMEALLYANNLLSYFDREVAEISLKNERMPSNSEIIQGAMYLAIAKEYKDYSIKVKRGSKMAGFSVQQDAVITMLSTLPNVEESSKINSIQHVDKGLSVSNKGISGMNNSRSYTITKRKWDKSFYGIMSDVSPYGPGTGITKHLAVNPNIKDIRGYFITKQPDDVRPDEVMSVSEALRPFTQRHDSSNRTAMSMMQSNHLMGTEGAEPALVTYGMDESMAFLDSDFAKRLKDDAEVVFVNDRYIKIRYTNLKKDDSTFIEEIITLDEIDRNAAKAFFIPNKLEINPNIKNLKIGSKIKKDTILAYNSNYYQAVGDDIVFKTGPIVNIAVMNTQYAYEDATFMSESLADKLRAKVLKRITMKLSAYNRIKEARTLLGPIAAGDIIMSVSEDTGSSFINKSYDLSALDEHLLKTKKSNYNGMLRDIYVYYKLTGEEKENMDPSIKKFISTVENFYKNRYHTQELSKNIPEYEKNRVVSHVTEFNDNRKNSVNGDLIKKGEILVEFFIEVEQNFSAGDKITIGNTALKGVDSIIVPDNKRPVGVATGKSYDLILSTYGPLNRMIYSTFMIGALTACMQKINEDIKKLIPNKKAILDLLSKYFKIDFPDVYEKYEKVFENMDENDILDYFNKRKGLIRLFVDDDQISQKKIDKLVKSTGVILEEQLVLHYKGGVTTKKKILVFPMQILKLQQMATKENASTINVTQRDMNNQATRSSKTGLITDDEISQMAAYGDVADPIIKELMSPRADNMITKKEMNEKIRENLEFSLDELSPGLEGRVSLYHLDANYTCMGIATDLIDHIDERS